MQGYICTVPLNSTILQVAADRSRSFTSQENQKAAQIPLPLNKQSCDQRVLTFYFQISDRWKKTSVLLFSRFGRNVFSFPVNNPKYAVKAVAVQIPGHCTARRPLERNDRLHRQKSRYQLPSKCQYCLFWLFFWTIFSHERTAFSVFSQARPHGTSNFLLWTKVWLWNWAASRSITEQTYVNLPLASFNEGQSNACTSKTKL